MRGFSLVQITFLEITLRFTLVANTVNESTVVIDYRVSSTHENSNVHRMEAAESNQQTSLLFPAFLIYVQ